MGQMETLRDFGLWAWRPFGLGLDDGRVRGYRA